MHTHTHTPAHSPLYNPPPHTHTHTHTHTDLGVEVDGDVARGWLPADDRQVEVVHGQLGHALRPALIQRPGVPGSAHHTHTHTHTLKGTYCIFVSIKLI